ncbi:hypothetical protein HPB47_021204 [Ixodes persulcatus]|uniref:Uncharacterized protein n=1 Tax=Ixodes persulcatus TaxID=34615 RepID=A0AC60QE43_IXOPE|nr:hypothetical protein HPB47_021204 [Ixodes persulcatus]
MASLLPLPRVRTRSESGSSCLSSRAGDCDTDEPRDPFYHPTKGTNCCPVRTHDLWVWFRKVKIFALVLLLLFAVVVVKLGNNSEPVHVSIKGPFLSRPLANITNVFTRVTLVGISNETSGDLVILKELFRAPTAPADAAKALTDTVIQEVINLHEFRDRRCRLLIEVEGPQGSNYSLQVQVTPKQEEFGISIPLAFVVLAVLYILIGFELVHRTLAALIGATLAVAFLSIVGERPSLERVVSWLDVETLCLLFGMMVLVGILCETGFFDYAAVLAYRLSRGRVWPMISMLCLFAAVISAFLDNVTTILLMTPVTIKLCEVMSLDPKQVLIILVLYSNIGGAATPVGDPPNVIIISNHMVKALGINFTSFTLHMLPGIILCAMGAFAFLRFYFRNPSTLRLNTTEAVEIEHEIDVWRKAVHSLAEYSRDESHVRDILSKKVRKLVRQQSKKSHYVRSMDFRENLRTLSDKYKIRKWSLLIKSGLVLLVVIVLFFMQSIPNVHLSLGWIAILGAVTLMILADLSELEGVIARVEWTTLIFFGALFVVMEALSELKLLLFVGHVTENWIRGVCQESRLIVSILIVTWVSSVVSSFVDNIPFTTVMIKVVTGLGESDLGLRLIPLVYSLAFGSCLGGNGTLIGASANVVCAGVAEQHGYKFSFVQFLRIGFPVMVLTTAISTGWLLLCHVVLQWDS